MQPKQCRLKVLREMHSYIQHHQATSMSKYPNRGHQSPRNNVIPLINISLSSSNSKFCSQMTWCWEHSLYENPQCWVVKPWQPIKTVTVPAHSYSRSWALSASHMIGSAHESLNALASTLKFCPKSLNYHLPTDSLRLFCDCPEFWGLIVQSF